MATSAEQMRAWRGPAILSYGFRPFFLGAALYTALAMGLWIGMLSGQVAVPMAFDPVSWHAHEFLFGYLGGVIAGFMLTAVPNWTGRLPIIGLPLAVLFGLWVIGRIAVMLSAHLPPVSVAAADLAMPCALAMVIAREIIAGRNWRNLTILGLLVVMITGNALFHRQIANQGYAADGYGLRLGLGAAVMLIAVVGGRIVPSFTRNWLVKQGADRLPAPPMQILDKIALFVLLTALLSWIMAPLATVTGVGLVVAGALHALRLARWRGHRTAAEPLVVVLHAGYAFVPLGAIGLGIAILRPDIIGAAAAQHLWMGGAIGLMTLAVMTRATLGHTGQPLKASAGTVVVYILVTLAALTRFGAGLFPEIATMLNQVSGMAWIVAFGGFGLLYGPALLRRNDRD